MSTSNRQSRRQRGEESEKILEKKEKVRGKFFEESEREKAFENNYKDLTDKFQKHIDNGRDPTDDEYKAYSKSANLKLGTVQAAYTAYAENRFREKLMAFADSFVKDSEDNKPIFDIETELPLLAVLLCEKIFKFRNGKKKNEEVYFVIERTGATIDQIENWFKMARLGAQISWLKGGRKKMDLGLPVIFQNPKVLDLCRRQFKKFPYFSQVFYKENLASKGETNEEVLRWFQQQLQIRRAEFTNIKPIYIDNSETAKMKLEAFQRNYPETWDYYNRSVEKGRKPTDEEFDSIAITANISLERVKYMHQQAEKLKDLAGLKFLFENFNEEDYVRTLLLPEQMEAQTEALCHYAFERHCQRLPQNTYIQLYDIEKEFISTNCKVSNDLIREWVRLENKSQGRRKIGQAVRKSKRIGPADEQQNREEEEVDNSGEPGTSGRPIQTVEEATETSRSTRAATIVYDELQDRFEDPQTAGTSSSSGVKRRPPPSSIDCDDVVFERDPNGPGTSGRSFRNVERNGAKKARTGPTEEPEDSGAADPPSSFGVRRRPPPGSTDRDDDVFERDNGSGTSGRIRVEEEASGTFRDGRNRGRNPRTQPTDEFDDFWIRRDNSEGSGTGTSSSSGVKRQRSPSSANWNPRPAKSSRTFRPIRNMDQDDRNLEFDAPTALEMPIQAGPSNLRPIEDDLNEMFNGPAVRSLAQAVVRIFGTLDEVIMDKTIQMFNTNFRNLLRHYENEGTARKNAFRGSGLQNLNPVLKGPIDVRNQNPLNDEGEDAPEAEAQVKDHVEDPEEAPEAKKTLSDEVNLGSVEADAEARRSEADMTPDDNEQNPEGQAPEDSENPNQESEEQGTSGILEVQQEDVAAEDVPEAVPEDSEVPPIQPEIEASGGKAQDDVRLENHYEASENDSEDVAPEDGEAEEPEAPEQEVAPEDNAETQEDQASDTEASETLRGESEEQETSGILENHREDAAPEVGHLEDDEINDVGGPLEVPEDQKDSDEVGHQQEASGDVPEALEQGQDQISVEEMAKEACRRLIWPVKGTEDLFEKILKAMGDMDLGDEKTVAMRKAAVRRYTGFWITKIQGTHKPSDKAPKTVLQLNPVAYGKVEEALSDDVLGHNVYKDLIGCINRSMETYRGHPEYNRVPHHIGIHFGFDYGKIKEMSEVYDDSGDEETPEADEIPQEESEEQAGTSGNFCTF